MECYFGCPVFVVRNVCLNVIVDKSKKTNFHSMYYIYYAYLCVYVHNIHTHIYILYILYIEFLLTFYKTSINGHSIFLLLLSIRQGRSLSVLGLNIRNKNGNMSYIYVGILLSNKTDKNLKICV